MFAALTQVTAASPARAEIVTVRHPQAVRAFQPDADIVQHMVDCGVARLTREPNAARAWQRIAGTNGTLGIKVFAASGRNSGTRPAVVRAVVRGLLAAGIPAERVVIWDREMSALRAAGFVALGAELGVAVRAAADAGWDRSAYYDTALIGTLVYGDVDFGEQREGAGRRSFFSKLLTHDLQKIINIAPVLNQNDAGVAGQLYSLALGGVDNTLRFDGSAGRLATAVPELYALPQLGERVVLNISDALIAQYEGGQHDLLHYALPLNELRFSHDPVALDVLALDDLERAREKNDAKRTFDRELYKNAALLELGVADRQRMDVVTIPLPAQGETSTR